MPQSLRRARALAARAASAVELVGANVYDARSAVAEVVGTRISAWCRWPDLMEPCEEGYRFTDPVMGNRLPLQLLVVAHRPARS